jgi:hypothetical protein
MSSNRERAAWTKFVEDHERAKQPTKRPRRKKEPQRSPQELEQALDDLTKERSPKHDEH